MPFTIEHGDITRSDTDAIVNAANTSLLFGGGVCGAIFEAAGIRQLEQACAAIGHCPTGQAVITPGFRLHAKYVIHTPGPVYSGAPRDEKLLSDCYKNSLELAAKNGCASIAFPLISAGIYGYPKHEALEVASRTIEDFLKTHEMDVRLVLYP